MADEQAKNGSNSPQRSQTTSSYTGSFWGTDSASDIVSESTERSRDESFTTYSGSTIESFSSYSEYTDSHSDSHTGSVTGSYTSSYTGGYTSYTESMTGSLAFSASQPSRYSGHEAHQSSNKSTSSRNTRKSDISKPDLSKSKSVPSIQSHATKSFRGGGSLDTGRMSIPSVISEETLILEPEPEPKLYKMDHGWKIVDLMGKARHRKVKSKFPIPGSTLRRDMARLRARPSSQNVLAQVAAVKGADRAVMQDVMTRHYHKRFNDGRDQSGARVRANLSRRSAILGEWEAEWEEREHAPKALTPAARALMDGLARNDLTRVRRSILASPIGIDDYLDEDRNTALMLACRHGTIAIVEFLLDSGANPNKLNKLGQHALYFSCFCWLTAAHSSLWKGIRMMQTQVLTEMLCHSGANVNLPGPRGLTALHSAAGYGRPPIIKVLLAMGGDPLRKADNGQTPIDVAESVGHHGCARLMSNWTVVMREIYMRRFKQEWEIFLESTPVSALTHTAESIQETLRAWTLKEKVRLANRLERGTFVIDDFGDAIAAGQAADDGPKYVQTLCDVCNSWKRCVVRSDDSVACRMCVDQRVRTLEAVALSNAKSALLDDSDEEDSEEEQATSTAAVAPAAAAASSPSSPSPRRRRMVSDLHRGKAAGDAAAAALSVGALGSRRRHAAKVMLNDTVSVNVTHKTAEKQYQQHAYGTSGAAAASKVLEQEAANVLPTDPYAPAPGKRPATSSVVMKPLRWKPKNPKKYVAVSHPDAFRAPGTASPPSRLARTGAAISSPTLSSPSLSSPNRGRFGAAAAAATGGSGSNTGSPVHPTNWSPSLFGSGDRMRSSTAAFTHHGAPVLGRSAATSGDTAAAPMTPGSTSRPVTTFSSVRSQTPLGRQGAPNSAARLFSSALPRSALPAARRRPRPQHRPAAASPHRLRSSTAAAAASSLSSPLRATSANPFKDSPSTADVPNPSSAADTDTAPSSGLRHRSATATSKFRAVRPPDHLLPPTATANRPPMDAHKLTLAVAERMMRENELTAIPALMTRDTPELEKERNILAVARQLNADGIMVASV